MGRWTRIQRQSLSIHKVWKFLGTLPCYRHRPGGSTIGPLAIVSLAFLPQGVEGMFGDMWYVSQVQGS